MTSTHTQAVEAAIATAKGLTAADEPLLALSRTLAAQMDATGTDGPGTRLAATNLTTIRSLSARIGPVSGGEDNALARLRAERPRPRPTKSRRAGS